MTALAERGLGKISQDSRFGVFRALHQPPRALPMDEASIKPQAVARYRASTTRDATLVLPTGSYVTLTFSPTVKSAGFSDFGSTKIMPFARVIASLAKSIDLIVPRNSAALAPLTPAASEAAMRRPLRMLHLGVADDRSPFGTPDLQQN
jgi:hypothetical protein